MEALSLGKTSKIIKSNHQPNTTMPAKPCLEISTHFLSTFRDEDSTTSLGSLFQCCGQHRRGPEAHLSLFHCSFSYRILQLPV